MRASRTLAIGSMSAAIALAIAPLSIAEDAPTIASQASMPVAATIPAPQIVPETAPLEILRQPINQIPQSGDDELPADRAFRESIDRTSLARNFHPADNDDGWRPYLGLTIEYNTICYKGQEEHGLEVVRVAPGSPAYAAGVNGPTPATMLGAAGAMAGAILAPVGMLSNPMLARAGHLGMGGDMIVAVNDERVRTPEKF